MPDTAEPTEQLRIGTLAERTATSTPTIRYYESIGLLPRAARQSGGQRRYDAEDVRRLTLIRRCREFGFPIEQVRVLVALVDDPNSSCATAREIGQAHLEAVRAKQRELRALEKMIAAFVERCDAECAGGAGPDCAPLLALSRPAPRVHVR